VMQRNGNVGAPGIERHTPGDDPTNARQIILVFTLVTIVFVFIHQPTSTRV
jgi:hypothetical protein